MLCCKKTVGNVTVANCVKNNPNTVTFMKKLQLIFIMLFLISTTMLLFGCNGAQYVFVQEQTLAKVQTSATDTIAACTVVDSDGEAYVDDELGNVLKLKRGNTVELEVNLSQADSLAFVANYYVLHNGLNSSEISVSVNGQEVLSRSSLPALWKNESDEFARDSYGNEVTPSQEKIEQWVSTELFNYDCSTVLAPVFAFNSGKNTITITVIAGGEFLLGDVQLKSVKMPETYAEYSQKYQSAKVGSGVVVQEAEFFAYKNNTMAIPVASGDINTTGYETYTAKLNVLSGLTEAYQSVSYKLFVETDGLYNLSLNYKNSDSNKTTFAKITIDGEAPFQELLIYPFTQNSSYEEHVLGGDTPYSVYLTRGEHVVTIKIDCSQTVESTDELSEIIDKLNDIYLDLKKIAGTIQDKNREWDPETDFPGKVEELKSIYDALGRINEQLKKVNGADVNYEALVFIQTAQKSIGGLLDDPYDIPNNYATLSEGSGSIVQTIANARNGILSTPLDIDKVILHPAGEESGVQRHGGFYGFWEGVKRFFHSFVADYSVTTDEEKTIQVWVARPSTYVNLMQQMMDASDFEERTGYSVRFSVLADEGKLILSNAADIAPNAVMGISNWLPYEMGIRDITVDLTQFDDYGEVISRFSEGAMISLIADGKGLALPETQDFYVMYYRKDVLDKYDIDLPNTWEDVIDILPKLQRYGLNFYIPLSGSTSSKSIMTTAPFIYQYGGSLFSDDATSTTIADENSLNAIKLMTELYTLYGLPQQINNFFDSFRNGSLPIGISTFDTYVRLSIAAPEIQGKWGIALSPGVLNEETGEIERWQTGSATSMSLIKSGSDDKDAAGWELLKWWSSAEVQTEFMNNLTMLYGKSYIWNSANLEAFNNSIVFTEEDKEIILEQWEWMREIPKVPGWYMLERELSNAWNSIVIDGENTRSVIENAVTTIDKELVRKLEEFGYMKDGQLVKEYTITTLDYIKKIKANS